MNSIFWSLLSTVIMSLAAYTPNPQLQRNSFIVEDTASRMSIRKIQSHPPEIITKDEKGHDVPLRVQEVSVNVDIIANIAVTTMEITFRNDLPRILEGELTFPLGNGQFITRFAMDINGSLREGVVVEKAQGRVIFEETVRKNIDPGLLELSRGNSFKARVYPIPANGTKKILIAYQQELGSDGDGDARYILPLDFKDTLSKFSLLAEVTSEVMPKFNTSIIIGAFVPDKNRGFALRINQRNVLANQPLEWIIPRPNDKITAYIETFNNEKYFTITATPPLLTASKTLPKRLCLFWDASASAAYHDKERELLLLDTYFKKIGSCVVQFVPFSNTVEKTELFTVSAGNWNALRTAIINLPSDGGTQFGAINLKNYLSDEVILITDGISSFGKSELTASNTPIIAINSAQHAEHSYLQYITRLTGGNYIDLTSLSDAQAAARIQEKPFSFLSASFDRNAIQEVYPQISTPINGNVIICGKLINDNADIILNFGFGSTITYTEKITLNSSLQSVNISMLPQLWAQKKIAELDMRYKSNKNTITELGKQFAIVTRNTSLLVLDRIEDYLQHHIVPHEDSLKKLYNSHITEQYKRQTLEDSSHIATVLDLFNQRKEWWNKTYQPKIKKNSTNPPNVEVIRGDGGAMTIMADRVPPVESSVIGAMRVAHGEDISIIASGRASVQDAVPFMTIPPSTLASSITLKKWDANTPYIQELKKTSAGNEYTRYLELKKEYGTNPGFFMDCADFFSELNNKPIALRILSNIAEMELENHQLLRVLAHRLEQIGYISLAIDVFRDVLDMREEEPQSYRDLALALAQNKQYQEAADTLYRVITKQWDSRFPEVELIALNEWNNILGAAKNTVNLTKYDKRFIAPMPVDVRVVLNWDADNCDMDLWVTDPNNEKCFYSHPNTQIGGRLSRDMTGGYGPEEFLLKKATSGTYKVQVQYYGSRQQKIAGATTIQVELYTRYMTGLEQKKMITLRLKDPKELIDVGEFSFSEK
jgi:tetratricopeptide (TPR) repeat protein